MLVKHWDQLEKVMVKQSLGFSLRFCQIIAKVFPNMTCNLMDDIAL